MINNVEAAGVHLADCTLLWCRHEIESQEGFLSADVARRTAVLGDPHPPMERDIAKQEASPHIRVDGELVSVNLALRYLRHAEMEYNTSIENEARRVLERKEFEQRQDNMRHIIIDQWAFGLERLHKMERESRGIIEGKTRGQIYIECYDALVAGHIFDELRLWSDEEQVMQRDREEGKRAYEAEKNRIKEARRASARMRIRRL
uniref:Paraflagellar rod protein n=1 Tax=Trypanosoma congolense (strain IL3000) TaxID=1068625 RepID=G0UKQ6_TRYCI|nr:conserved hypothetical protein [Trypanosoma congolense IL3000]